MKSGSWSSYQSALPHEARQCGERDDPADDAAPDLQAENERLRVERRVLLGAAVASGRLIVELAAALRRMLAAHDADVARGSLVAAGNSQAADQARAALAKAEGR